MKKLIFLLVIFLFGCSQKENKKEVLVLKQDQVLPTVKLETLVDSVRYETYRVYNNGLSGGEKPLPPKGYISWDDYLRVVTKKLIASGYFVEANTFSSKNQKYVVPIIMVAKVIAFRVEKNPEVSNKFWNYNFKTQATVYYCSTFEIEPFFLYEPRKMRGLEFHIDGLTSAATSTILLFQGPNDQSLNAQMSKLNEFGNLIYAREISPLHAGGNFSCVFPFLSDPMTKMKFTANDTQACELASFLNMLTIGHGISSAFAEALFLEGVEENYKAQMFFARNFCIDYLMSTGLDYQYLSSLPNQMLAEKIKNIPDERIWPYVSIYLKNMRPILVPG